VMVRKIARELRQRQLHAPDRADMGPARLAPDDLRRDMKGELQVHAQANMQRVVPIQCARRPRFGQRRVLHEKLNLALGVRGVSTGR